MTKALLLSLALSVLAGAPAQARCSARTTQEKARAIARHAWGKHRPEFAAGRRIAGLAFPAPGLGDEAALADHVARILDQVRGEPISSGRTKFWDGKSGTIVIFNARARDCGTSFRPNPGRRYYDRQR